MRKLAKSKSGKLLAITISAALTLILPGIALQNAKAAGSLNLRKELVIPAGATSRMDFSAGKNEPMSIAISGRSQKTASGFNGYCKTYLSNGEYAYDYVAFANDQISVNLFTPSVGGSFFLNCQNSSTKEDAIILVTVDSFESISNSSSGNMRIPALENALVSFNAIKNTPIFISNLGNAKTSAKGFTGFCRLYDNAGSYTYESFTFSSDSGNSLVYLPKYSGTYVLQCANTSDEIASFNLSLYSASSLRSGSVTSISATAHGSVIFKFSAEKGLPLSISTKGNAKSTPTGFSGYCQIYDSNGTRDLDWVSFGSNQVGSRVVTPKYSGDYYLFCNNQGNESAMFQIFGLRDLTQIEPTASFKTTGANSDSPSISPSLTPKPTAFASPKPTNTAIPQATPKVIPTSKATSSTLRSCPKYIFIGMRGSGEKYESGYPKGTPTAVQRMGWEIGSLYLQLSKESPFKGNITYSGVDSYTASGVPSSLSAIPQYINDLKNESTINVTRELSTLIGKCESDTGFILAGYSQGAYAAHFLADFLDSRGLVQGKRVKAVILLADPAKPVNGILPYLQRVMKDGKFQSLIEKCAVTIEVTNKIKKLWPLTKKSDLTNLCADLNNALIAATAVSDNFSTPKSIPTFYYDFPRDIITDLNSVLIDAGILNVTKDPRTFAEFLLTVNALLPSAVKVHSAYCPESSKQLNKDGSKKCKDVYNQTFIKKSIEFLNANIRE